MKAIGFIAAAVFALFLLATPGTAQAQATRTWVSGTGNDANPCSRTAPCKTFAGAISKTATAGEINCIDSGGYGGVTIIKSMSIICDGVEAGVLVASSNGITVNAPAGSVVYLSGLDIQGISGLVGVSVIGSGTLHINNTIIHGFNTGAAIGVNFAPANIGYLTITNSIIRDNGAGTSGGGVSIAPASGGGAFATVSHSTIANNSIGLFVADNTASSATLASVDDTVVSGNAGAGLAAYGTGTPAATLMVARSMSVNNGVGLTGSGANATIRIGQSVITGNATGVKVLGSPIIRSYGDNQFNDNTVPGPTIITIPPS